MDAGGKENNEGNNEEKIKIFSPTNSDLPGGKWQHHHSRKTVIILPQQGKSDNITTAVKHHIKESVSALQWNNNDSSLLI